MPLQNRLGDFSIAIVLKLFHGPHMRWNFQNGYQEFLFDSEATLRMIVQLIDVWNVCFGETFQLFFSQSNIEKTFTLIERK